LFHIYFKRKYKKINIIIEKETYIPDCKKCEVNFVFIENIVDSMGAFKLAKQLTERLKAFTKTLFVLLLSFYLYHSLDVKQR